MKRRITPATALLATLLLALSVLVTALAQDADDDNPPATEQDAQDVLGDRAKAPDLSNDTPPPGVQQSDNAGTANITVPAENMTETKTRSSEHSSSFSVGVDDDRDDDDGRNGRDERRSRVPVAGEIANNPPPPAGWPGARHANRPQQTDGPVATINAGPIWNNNDARGKCPNVCGQNHMGWTGNWRTVGFNKSVCDCAVYASRPNDNSAHSGPGSYCEAPANHQCAGCSVNCPGNQIAHCTQGDRGIFTGDNAALCARDAKCECN